MKTYPIPENLKEQLAENRAQMHAALDAITTIERRYRALLIAFKDQHKIPQENFVYPNEDFTEFFVENRELQQ